MTSPADQWVTLTQRASKVDESEIEAVFNQLPPVSPESLLGEWRGRDLDTGHPGVQRNKELRWAGKSFISVEDVRPMVVFDDAGNRVWNQEIGGARLREVKYNGVLSAAMIYNTKPIIDHFRNVNDTMVAGVMDTNLMKDCGRGLQRWKFEDVCYLNKSLDGMAAKIRQYICLHCPVGGEEQRHVIAQDLCVSCWATKYPE